MRLGLRIPRYLPCCTDVAATVQDSAQLHLIREPSRGCRLGCMLPTYEGVWNKAWSARQIASPSAPHSQLRLLTSEGACFSFTCCHPLSSVASPGTWRKRHHEHTIRAMWSRNGPNATTMSGTQCSQTRKRTFVAASCSPTSSTHHRLKTRIQQDA
jgi:hypothetical protein